MHLHQAMPKRVRKHEATTGVAHLVGTVRIQLSTTTRIREEYLIKRASSTDLHIVRCFDKVHTLQRAVRNQTRATTRLGAVAHHFTLRLADTLGDRPWPAPQAEVRSRVDVQILAHRRLVRTRSARVRSNLLVFRFLGKRRGLRHPCRRVWVRICGDHRNHAQQRNIEQSQLCHRGTPIHMEHGVGEGRVQRHSTGAPRARDFRVLSQSTRANPWADGRHPN